MGSMTVEPIGIYTVADLERSRERDDRLRWELLDGELVVTPSPRTVHQAMSASSLCDSRRRLPRACTSSWRRSM